MSQPNGASKNPRLGLPRRSLSLRALRWKVSIWERSLVCGGEVVSASAFLWSNGCPRWTPGTAGRQRPLGCPTTAPSGGGRCRPQALQAKKGGERGTHRTVFIPESYVHSSASPLLRWRKEKAECSHTAHPERIPVHHRGSGISTQFHLLLSL